MLSLSNLRQLALSQVKVCTFKVLPFTTPGYLRFGRSFEQQIVHLVPTEHSHLRHQTVLPVYNLYST